MMDKLKQHLPAIAVGAAGLAAIGLAWFMLSGSDREETADAGAKAAPPTEPAPAGGAGGTAGAPPNNKSGQGRISREQLLHVLDDMTRSVEGIIAERDRKRSAAIAAGTPEEEAEELAGEFLQTQMAELDDELQTRHHITQLQLQEAQEEYREDPEIKARLHDLQVLIVGREQMEEMARIAASAPPDMTADLFLPIFKRHLDHMEAAMNALLDEVERETAGQPPEQRGNYFQFMLMRNMERIQQEAAEATAMEPEVFEACMMRFGQEPRLAALVVAMQQRQMVRMAQFNGSA